MARDDDWYGTGSSIDRDRLNYELRKTAASKVARSDPDIAKAARISNFEQAEGRAEVDRIGANLEGHSAPPRIFQIRQRLLRIRGKVQRVDQADQLYRTLLSVQSQSLDEELKQMKGS